MKQTLTMDQRRVGHGSILLDPIQSNPIQSNPICRLTSSGENSHLQSEILSTFWTGACS